MQLIGLGALPDLLDELLSAPVELVSLLEPFEDFHERLLGGGAARSHVFQELHGARVLLVLFQPQGEHVQVARIVGCPPYSAEVFFESHGA